MKTDCPVVVIGGGPAGLACALQLSRHRIPFRLIEKAGWGGLLRNAGWVENYPGFPQGISGLDLIERFKQSVINAGIPVYEDEVRELDHLDGSFRLKLNGGELKTSLVAVASGTIARKPKELEIAPEALPLVYEEVYPLFEVRGKSMAVIGAGDAAFDYSLSLAKGNRVFLLNRSERIKALPVLRQRVFERPSIEYRENFPVEKVVRAGERLQLSGHRASSLEIDYLLFAVGRDPQTGFFSPRLREDAADLIQAGLLYLAGDVQNQECRQTAIAVGDGIKTAMQIKRKLEEARE